MKLNFDVTVDFPPAPGTYIRLVLGDSENENAAVVYQGHLMKFLNDRKTVDLMHDGTQTTPEIVMQGDVNTRKQGMAVCYARLSSIGEEAAQAQNIILP